MRKPVCILLFLSSVLFIACTRSADESASRKVFTPESQGISSQAILDFIEAAESQRKDELHSFILLRHGKVLAEAGWDPCHPDTAHILFSLSKSFTSTAIGMAQAEGLLSIHDPVISFFPDETPENPSENLRNMRIRDLLRMNSGHREDPVPDLFRDSVSWVKKFLNQPVEFKPGSRFAYNTSGTFMMSAIIQKVTGVTLQEYLSPRLFEPLKINNPVWIKNMNGINTGGWGLRISTKDIASFGQLYLQKGLWNGKQLVPSAWIKEAGSLQSSTGSNPEIDWDQGYGYQFWQCRHGVYRGDGLFGQFCFVMPEQDAVVAITAGSNNMQAVMNLIWLHLLPAMKEKPLPANDEAYTALQTKLGSLKLSLVEGEETSSVENQISGKTWIMKPGKSGIESMRFDLAGKDKLLTITKEGETYGIPIGFGEQKTGAYEIRYPGKEPVSTSGAWTSDNTFKIRSYFYKTPFFIEFDVKFEKDVVSVQQDLNLPFLPEEFPPLEGVCR